jgi:hypothetical protein
MKPFVNLAGVSNPRNLIICSFPYFHSARVFFSPIFSIPSFFPYLFLSFDSSPTPPSIPISAATNSATSDLNNLLTASWFASKPAD